MAVGRDIVAVSIPFTAGVVVAAALPLKGESFVWPALCCSVCLIPLFSLLLGRKADLPVISAIFFLLGFICYANSEMGCSLPLFRPSFLSGASESLAASIDGAGFGPETASLLKALLTGRRDSLSSETAGYFRNSGASHILALSGLHLGIICSLVSKLLKILGNSRSAAFVRSLFTIAFSGFYVLMTGASASIVRAFLFIVFNETGRHSPGRKRSRLNTFCSALTIQLSFRPELITSAGFQLSYLAMLGILVLFPVLEAWYPSGKSLFRIIWKSMAMSVSCQFFTAPAAWWHFRTFPKYFLLTNLISLPLAESLIVSSVLALLLDAFGICPDTIKGLCDFLARTLIFCLRTISSL